MYVIIRNDYESYCVVGYVDTEEEAIKACKAFELSKSGYYEYHEAERISDIVEVESAYNYTIFINSNYMVKTRKEEIVYLSGEEEVVQDLHRYAPTFLELTVVAKSDESAKEYMLIYAERLRNNYVFDLSKVQECIKQAHFEE